MHVDLKQLIDALPGLGWSALPDGRAEFVNRRWLEYTGLNAAQAADWGWTMVIHPDDRRKLLEHWQTCLACGTPVDTEGRMRRHDGAYRRFLFRADPLRDDSGNISRWFGTNIDVEDRALFVGALQDVTESKLAEEALNTARSELANVTRLTALSALTASIAHEVNQPLAGIIMNASSCLQMLSGNPPNLNGAREAAARTLRDANRASDVVRRLRALFSRKEFKLEPMDLNDATREVIALTLSDLQRNRVVLRCELADDLPLVTGDRVQLQQVVLNMIRNGSDAMAEVDDRARDLLIKTERSEGDRVCLSVRDAGVGFGPEATDKLFQPFYTTKTDGMGIGLSISRTIIEAHHGRLWATANAGAGATFCFFLPCQLAPTSGLQDLAAAHLA
jgi:PAS domain S-box-containing protein